jgi:hypothetical protein
MIYVLEEGINGPIKIGTSSNPTKRKKYLQIGNSKQLNLIMVFEGGRSLENKIHKDLSKHRDRSRKDGEWFNRNDAVFKYLNELSPVEPKTEWLNGYEYIVLWRETEESPTDFCPFCGKRHTHGQGDGHRTEHCAFGNETFTRKSDGKIFEQNKGYIVRTKKQNIKNHTTSRYSRSLRSG